MVAALPSSLVTDFQSALMNTLPLDGHWLITEGLATHDHDTMVCWHCCGADSKSQQEWACA
jgi:hypothetical protein